jgi:hypothetical protein
MVYQLIPREEGIFNLDRIFYIVYASPQQGQSIDYIKEFWQKSAADKGVRQRSGEELVD